MAGVQELGEVQSYPVPDGFTVDDEGYVCEALQNGTDEVQVAVSASGLPLFGVAYISTEDQKERVRAPPHGLHDFVTESAEFPVKADAGTYELRDDLYVSSTNDGHVNTTDTTNRRVGTVTRSDTLDEDGDKLLAKFDFS